MTSELNITLLYKEQGPFIARTIRRLVGEGPHVDDLLQETFIVAYKKRERFDPGRSKSSTWLYGIAFNLCRHFERSERRAGLFKRRLMAIQEESVSYQTPGTALEEKQSMRLIHNALRKLPMKQREAFVLFELEGLGGKAISEMLEIKEGTVWTRIHKARKRFLKQIGENGAFHA